MNKYFKFAIILAELVILLLIAVSVYIVAIETIRDYRETQYKECLDATEGSLECDILLIEE